MRFYESKTAYDGTLGGLDFNRVARRQSPQHLLRVAEAARMWNAMKNGIIDPFFIKQAMRPTRESAYRMLCQEFPVLFKESMTTSDFASLTVDALDRMILKNYTSVEMHYPAIAKKATLRDFRDVKRTPINGAEGRFEAVEERADFKRRSITEGDPYTYKPVKYEAGGEVSWEAAINDDLGIFSDFTTRLATGARRTIERSVSEKYLDTNGPHATFFTNARLNKVNVACGAGSNNPGLSIDGIGEGLTVLYSQKDSDGEPIIIEAVTLVVGPSNYVTAENIQNATLVDATIKGGSTNSRARINNWIINKLTVVRNPYIPIIATSKPNSWFLFASPEVGRPALEIGFLAGFDQPQLYQKAPNTMAIGGAIDPNLGDFNTMCREFKALVVFGDVQMEPKSAVGSDGSGS